MVDWCALFGCSQFERSPIPCTINQQEDDIYMEQFIDTFISNHGHLIYPLVLIWTFFEGETIVLIIAAIAAEKDRNISLALLTLSATAGTLWGDQLFYYLGRHYGTPFLAARPKLAAKADWAFKLVRKSETLFILSYRFIYGVRNVSPFVVGVSGIPPLRFLLLNLTASTLWAMSFVAGGYLLGRAMQIWLEDYKLHVLAGIVVLIGSIYAYNYFKDKKINQT